MVEPLQPTLCIYASRSLAIGTTTSSFLDILIFIERLIAPKPSASNCCYRPHLPQTDPHDERRELRT